MAKRNPYGRVKEKDGKWYRLKKNGSAGVELTHNGNTMTKSEHISMILGALRGVARFWIPKTEALNKVCRPSQRKDKRVKKEYCCKKCNNWFKRTEVEVDHIIPCGGIRDYKDIPGWCKRAFVGVEGLQVLCKTCHKDKTNSEKKNK